MKRESVEIRFKDTEYKKYVEAGISLKDLLQTLNLPPHVLRDIVGARVNGKLVDLFYEINSPCEIEWVKAESKDGLYIIRHSASHVMAQAVQEMFPEAKLAIGPPTEDGFYYDFKVNIPFTEEDLKKIERRMKEIIEEDHPFKRKRMRKEEALDYFKKRGEIFKVEIIEELEDEEVTLYTHDNFTDLCRGPHLLSTGRIGAFKLLSSSGAYWRGDEERDSLQRIYGTAFSSREALEEFLKVLEEAKRRDHRILGKELDLFSIHEEAGAGLVFWHPRGAIVRKIIEDFWKEEHLKRNYRLIYTPHIARIDLWDRSGHTNFYKENMFAPMKMGNISYQLKPMNCPFHIILYRSKVTSYRELPVRFAELGTVYRFERSGVLHGLMRVRGFTQDDAHIFTSEEKLKEEVSEILNLTFSFMRVFSFKEFEVYLSTRPEKFAGSIENWEKAEEILKKTLEELGIHYEVDPGEGVFYGPKIDVKVKDAIGRLWQTTTIQVDFNLPERFDLTYVSQDNRPKRPIMIHRALFGSLERFFGILIEHYGGSFPVWLAPEQARIIPVSENFISYGKKCLELLRGENLRVELDGRNETLSYRVREAELMKVPFIVVVGEKEASSGTVAVRSRQNKKTEVMELESFLKKLREEARIPQI